MTRRAEGQRRKQDVHAASEKNAAGARPPPAHSSIMHTPVQSQSAWRRPNR
jgi:hypothetical protein